MIGDGHDREACSGRLLDELERRASAVGRGGMKVKIDADHRALTRAVAGDERVPRRVRPCRLTSARYSRISKSR